MNKQFKYYKTPLLVFVSSFFIFSHHCQAEITAMSDEELETITGTGFSASPTSAGTIDFTFDKKTKDGTPISGSGSLDVLKKTDIDSVSADTISLNGSAQENLRALVNVNSVNSAIQVLLNLNVNINSTVESLAQTNQAQLNE